jgi:SAM-dependent methyltransferase
VQSIITEHHTFYPEAATRLYGYAIFRGIFHGNGNESFSDINIRLVGDNCEHQMFEVKKESSDSINAFKFQLEVLTKKSQNLTDLKLVVSTDDKATVLSAADFINAIDYVAGQLYEEFRAKVLALPKGHILDIGGRARSGLLRSESFHGLQTTVLDIVPDEGVDICGDAHVMSTLMPHNSFDACVSVSVFEHLVMPWKVVIEANKLLKLGGYFFISTHQTVGMHDLPWDFYRFSNEAWHGLFNAYTGFEIVNTEMSGLNHIVPFKWSAEKNDSEKACGYESSAVLARKISNTSLKWEVSAADILNTHYPSAKR